MQVDNTHLLCKVIYHCMADLLFDRLGFGLKSKSVYSFNSTKQLNPNQSNRRSAIQWYFPLWIKWVFSEARLNSILLVIWRCDLTIQPWSSLVEGGEGSYLPNCQTTLVIALDSLSLLFCIFESTTVYHLGRYYLLLLKSSVISVTRFGDFLHFGKLFKGFGNI